MKIGIRTRIVAFMILTVILLAGCTGNRSGKVFQDIFSKLFYVTVTIPFNDNTTQERLDEKVRTDAGIKSAKLNADGSVTYILTKKKQKQILEFLSENLDIMLEELEGSEITPDIVSIQANKDYTEFVVITNNTEPNSDEEESVMTIVILFGGTYNAYNGLSEDDIHVIFKNADTGVVIKEICPSDYGPNYW